MSSISSEIIKNIVRDVAQKASNLLKSTQSNTLRTSNSDASATVQAALKHSSGPWQVSETLAAFILRSVVLNPETGLQLESALSREDVERITSQCVAKIVAVNDPEIEAVKMQVYFDTAFPVQADFLHKENATKLNITQSYLKEITDFKQKTVSGYENLYCKIVSYIMVRNQLNSATDLAVVRETTAALESVYPQSELGTFISMPRAEKEAQINGLVHLVTGIRLFNRQLQKGGQSIEDIPQKCHELLASLLQCIKATAADAQAQVKKLGHALADSSNRKLLHALIFHRQLLVYLSTMDDICKASLNTVHSLDQKYSGTLQMLRDTCQSRSAVPVDQVYPGFISLAHLWNNYQDELFCIAFRQGIVDTLLNHMNSFDVSEALADAEAKMNQSSLTGAAVQGLSHAFEDVLPQPDNEIVQAANELMSQVTLVNRQVEVLHPYNYTQYKDLSLEYGGFCPVTLVATGGIVVPANRNLGILRYHEKTYGFCTAEAAKQFVQNPQHYIENVVDLAKQYPDLVELLQLYSFFPTVETLEKAKSYTREKLLGRIVVRSDTGCQTDTHINDGYIDPKYQWNEWELRRQAIMLVNLRKKATHSTQTKSSSFKRDSETQVYPQKEQTTQTVKSSATQVAPIRHYLGGLRHESGKKANFKVVDLTFEL